MPFTFAHPAIVLPLLKVKKWFSPTGLVIGSIAPDFESFIRLNKPKIYSHTWTGIFWYDLPLTIIIALIFHGLVRDPLIANMPKSLRQRFDRFSNSPWITYFKKHIVLVIFSMLIGITSHLLWDAFTHLNLRSPDATDSIIYLGRTRVYLILQYSNSLLGLAVIMWYIYKMPQTPVAQSNLHRRQYWPVLILIIILVAISETLITGITHNIITYIEISISSFFAGLIIISLVFNASLLQKKK